MKKKIQYIKQQISKLVCITTYSYIVFVFKRLFKVCNRITKLYSHVSTKNQVSQISLVIYVLYYKVHEYVHLVQGFIHMYLSSLATVDMARGLFLLKEYSLSMFVACPSSATADTSSILILSFRSIIL